MTHKHHDPFADLPAQLRRRKVSLMRHFRTAFITGILTLIPLAVSFYILLTLFNFFIWFSRPIARFLLTHLIAPLVAGEIDPDTFANWTAPILSFFISAIVIYVLGLLGIFAIGKRILKAGDHFIENLPLIKGIYGTTKQVIAVFRTGGGGQGFQRVVLVEFPRRGTFTIAFVTNTILDVRTNTKLVCTFIPMTPNPTSGFFQMFPEDDVRATTLTVDQGIKIVLSGGLLAPEHFDTEAVREPPRTDEIQAPKPA
jgi:uncharacterized membrane protein